MTLDRSASKSTSSVRTETSSRSNPDTLSASPPVSPETSPQPVRPARGSRSARAAAVIGLAQAGALAVYCVAVAVSATSTAGSRTGGQTTSFAPAMVVVYLLFGLGIAAASVGLWRGAQPARTPFALAQAFGLVVAYTLASSGESGLVATGLILGLSSLVAIVAVLREAVGSS